MTYFRNRPSSLVLGIRWRTEEIEDEDDDENERSRVTIIAAACTKAPSTPAHEHTSDTLWYHLFYALVYCRP